MKQLYLGSGYGFMDSNGISTHYTIYGPTILSTLVAIATAPI